MDAYEEKLVIDHLELAKQVSRKIYRTAPHALELDELTSIAYTGLVQAAQRWKSYCQQRGYDSSRMDFFQVVARQRCHGAILDVLRSQDFATRSLRAKSKRLQEAGQDSGVSTTELAARTGMSRSEVSRVQRGMSNKPVSLEADGSDFEILQTTESIHHVNQMLSALVAGYNTLSVEAQIVIALHYYEGLELQKVAQRLSAPESWVSSLHTEAVLFLHGELEKIALEGTSD